MNGTIKKLVSERGFGFITKDGASPTDKDLFFHMDALVGVVYESLKEGQAVTYEEGSSNRGPCAVNVQLA